MRAIAFLLMLEEVIVHHPRRSIAPDGRRFAEVRQAAGGDSVWVGERRVWTGRGHVAGAPVWSAAGDAIAFVARDGAVAQLVVVLPDDAAETDIALPGAVGGAEVIT